MIRNTIRPVTAALLAVLTLAPAARSATFDFIFADRIDVRLCSECSGLTLAEFGYGLIVNKAATDIDAGTLFGAQFSVVSSNPSFQLHPFINDPGPAVAPVVPDEAIGSVRAINSVLTTKLLPSETFRNTHPLQVIAFQLETGGAAGAADFDVTMTMGGEVVKFPIHITVTPANISSAELAFPSAARVSSTPLHTPTRKTTWGRVKAAYR